MMRFPDQDAFFSIALAERVVEQAPNKPLGSPPTDADGARKVAAV